MKCWCLIGMLIEHTVACYGLLSCATLESKRQDSKKSMLFVSLPDRTLLYWHFSKIDDQLKLIFTQDTVVINYVFVFYMYLVHCVTLVRSFISYTECW